MRNFNLAKTGDLIWEWNEGVPISAEVAVGDRAVYVATRAGDVIAIAPVAAERLAEGSAPSDDESDPGSPGVVPPDDSSPTTTVPPSRGGGGGTM